jgi:hypothetical protein
MKRITKVLNIICLTLLITTITTLSFSAPPTITSVSPSSGERGQTLDIFITGTNLGGATSVYFTGTDIKVNKISPMIGPRPGTRLKVNISIYGTAQLGPKDVFVRTPEGEAKGIKLFLVAGPPVIKSVIPSKGAEGGTVDVTINGEGFYGLTRVDFGRDIYIIGAPRVESEYVPTTIYVTIRISRPVITYGRRDVVVETNHGRAVGTGLFYVEAVVSITVVSSVFPDNGWQGQTRDVTIRGVNLSETTAVSFGAGITVNTFTVVSSTEIRANISISNTADLGSRDVTVTTPRRTAVGRGLFRVTRLI